MFSFLKNINLKRKNVVGHTEDKNKITFFVTRKKTLGDLHPRDVLPSKILWKKTDVVEIGNVEAQVMLSRQVMPYSSIKKGKLHSGTLGLVVQKLQWQLPFVISDGVRDEFWQFFQQNKYVTSQKYVLTNYHVAFPDYKEKFDDWYGYPTCLSVKNKAFSYVNGSKKCDAALLSASTKVGEEWMANHERMFTVISPQVGDLVRKEGRTTGKTSGKLVARNVTIVVSYEGGGDIKCTGVDMYEGLQGKPFSQKGDSGSAIFKEGTQEVVGLLFAGSEKYTFAYPMTTVFSELGLDEI